MSRSGERFRVQDYSHSLFHCATFATEEEEEAVHRGIRSANLRCIIRRFSSGGALPWSTACSRILGSDNAERREPRDQNVHGNASLVRPKVKHGGSDAMEKSGAGATFMQAAPLLEKRWRLPVFERRLVDKWY